MNADKRGPGRAKPSQKPQDLDFLNQNQVPPLWGSILFSAYPPFPASLTLAFRVGSIMSRLRRWGVDSSGLATRLLRRKFRNPEAAAEHVPHPAWLTKARPVGIRDGMQEGESISTQIEF